MPRNRKGGSAIGAEMVRDIQEMRDAMLAGELERRFTVRRVTRAVRPRDYAPAGVRRVRERLNVSQKVFADFLGVSLITLQSWEQGRRAPLGIARRFLDEISREPDRWAERVREASGPAKRRVRRAAPSAA